jgi:hypothetical protein
LEGLNFQTRERKTNLLDITIREEDNRFVVILGNTYTLMEISRDAPNILSVVVNTDQDHAKYDFDVSEDTDETEITVTTDEVF